MSFIYDGIRTPIGRFAGALSSIRTDDLAAIPITHLIAKHPQIDWARLDDVILGCANQAGEDNRNIARMAVLLAGLPIEIPATTINRLCGSGLDAIGFAARSIRANDTEFILAGGVESMSRAPFVMPKAEQAFSRQNNVYDTTIGWRFINPKMQEIYGTDSMAETADNVAHDFNISRQDQDAFAARSQHRWQQAHDKNIFADEICPVTIPQKKGEALSVTQDEHPRPTTTLDALAKLRPINAGSSTVTAGNAAGINDGAAALLIGDEALQKTLNIAPRARIIGMAAAGVEPRIMGMGPLSATQKLLDSAKLTIADMDVIELNEAFAAQSLAILRAWGLPDDAEHVNPNGGAIALGHPLGMSGARLVLTATAELQRRKGRYALCTMCVGVGQGLAMLLERV